MLIRLKLGRRERTQNGAAGLLGRFGFIAVLALSIGGPGQVERAHADEPAASEAPTQSLAFYAGPTVPTSLVDLIRLRRVEFESDSIMALAYARDLGRPLPELRFEVEGSLAQHLEQWGRVSLAAAGVGRWLAPPWGRQGGASVALGNGLSWASSVPAIEQRRLERTSLLLYHLIFEFTVEVPRGSGWEALLRMHHRSGAFGLFGNVVGGSDFLCLGLRRRF